MHTSVGRNSTRQPISVPGGGGLNLNVCQLVDWIFCTQTAYYDLRYTWRESKLFARCQQWCSLSLPVVHLLRPMMASMMLWWQCFNKHWMSISISTFIVSRKHQWGFLTTDLTESKLSMWQMSNNARHPQQLAEYIWFVKQHDNNNRAVFHSHWTLAVVDPIIIMPTGVCCQLKAFERWLPWCAWLWRHISVVCFG